MKTRFLLHELGVVGKWVYTMELPEGGGTDVATVTPHC